MKPAGVAWRAGHASRRGLRVLVREHGAGRGGHRVETAPGIRELVDGIADPHGAVAAAFDTRFRGPAWLMGAASKAIVRRLRRRGFDVAAPPESFVLGPRKTRGPLAEGELDRAFAWGAELGRRAAMRWHASGVA